MSWVSGHPFGIFPDCHGLGGPIALQGALFVSSPRRHRVDPFSALALEWS